MKLFLHQFKKDLRQTWVIWALWLLFVVVQFVLAGLNLSTDSLGTGMFAQLLGLIPTLHGVLLFVLIPTLVMLDPPVGTTASWLTRPLSPRIVLGSKLFSLGILVLFPLLGQCAILLAHHVVLGDVVFAAMEIALKEAHVIAFAMALAVICPSFARFVVSAAVIGCLVYFGDTIWGVIAPIIERVFTFLKWPALSTYNQGLSQNVVEYLLCIIVGLAITIYQYLTRQTRSATLAFATSLLVIGIMPRVWTWDFIGGYFTTNSILTNESTFDASAIHMRPSSLNVQQSNMDFDSGSVEQTVNLQFNDLSPVDYHFELASKGGELKFPDGTTLSLSGNGPTVTSFEQQSNDSIVVDSSLDNLVEINRTGYFYQNQASYVGNLFQLDSNTLAKAKDRVGMAHFDLDGTASSYRIAAEIPIEVGQYFSNGSTRTTLVHVLHEKEGVSMELQQRSMDLIFHQDTGGPQPVYVLVNRARSEMLISSSSMSNGSPFFMRRQFTNQGMTVHYSGSDFESDMGRRAYPAFSGLPDIGDKQFEVTTSIGLNFGGQNNQMAQRLSSDNTLPIEIDDNWLRDARLVKLEVKPLGKFTLPIDIPDLNLKNLNVNLEDNASNEERDKALKAITLPANPSRNDIWRYITHVLAISANRAPQQAFDPQVDALIKLGPERSTELMIAAYSLNDYYPSLALESMDLSKYPEAKAILRRILPGIPGLVKVVSKNHWEKDFKDILVSFVANRRDNNSNSISDDWIDALDALSDDKDAKAALISLVPSNEHMVDIVLRHHWEQEVKPILIEAFAHSRRGTLSVGWVNILASFHDESEVKASLLRGLSENVSGAIDAVLNNHWEADALPILLEKMAKSPASENYDQRVFEVLSEFGNRPEVKSAILRALPANQDAITAVEDNHWEEDAEPIVFKSVDAATPNQSFSQPYINFLGGYGDRAGVKEAILKLLANDTGCLPAIIANHWESDAEPIMLAQTKATPNQYHYQEWYDVLGSFPNRPGVKDLLLFSMRKEPSALNAIRTNHWESDAEPFLTDTMLHSPSSQTFDQQAIEIVGSFPDRPEAKRALLYILPSNETAIGPIIQNHWEEDALPIVLKMCAKVSRQRRLGDGFVPFLSKFHDRPGVKDAILNILTACNNAIDLIYAYHWESDALPRVIETMERSTPNEYFDGKLIRFVAEHPEAPHAKEALLHVLDRNEEAVKAVLDNHWENDAKPILLRIIQTKKDEYIEPSYLKALVASKDPSTYPVLIKYIKSYKAIYHLSYFLEAMRDMPGSVIRPAIDEIWHKVKGASGEDDFLPIAVGWGNQDALDRAVDLATEKAPDESVFPAIKDRLKEVAVNQLWERTPLPMNLLHVEKIAWYAAHRLNLTFDPQLNRFVFHAHAGSPDDPILSVADYTSDLGHRAVSGDKSAIDELISAVERSIEGLQPPNDQEKIDRIQATLCDPMFDKFENEVKKQPEALAVLDYANNQALLRPYVARCYGRAAANGNDDAWTVIQDWKSRQWPIEEVLRGLSPMIKRGDLKGINFVSTLSTDPNVPHDALEGALDALREAADAGNKPATDAYHSLLSLIFPSVPKQ